MLAEALASSRIPAVSPPVSRSVCVMPIRNLVTSSLFALLGPVVGLAVFGILFLLSWG
jgi:hypothetical protein